MNISQQQTHLEHVKEKDNHNIISVPLIPQQSLKLFLINNGLICDNDDTFRQLTEYINNRCMEIIEKMK
jgi:hypothetical protein